MVCYSIIFFLPAVVTSTLMIGDRLEGVWERSAVAGVRAREMLHVHIALQAAVILLQVIHILYLLIIIISLLMSPSLGHMISLWVTHEKKARRRHSAGWWVLTTANAAGTRAVRSSRFTNATHAGLIRMR
jgi:hypothetical protein